MSDTVSDSSASDSPASGDQASWPTTPSARHKARRFALQALYSWQVGGGTAQEIEAYYRSENDMCKTDVGYFHELLRGVIGNTEELDAGYATFLDRPVKELDPIERAILRIGVFELLRRPELPVRVAINEGIELAKMFGATDDSHKYINGVLDKVARRLRAAELSGRA